MNIIFKKIIVALFLPVVLFAQNSKQAVSLSEPACPAGMMPVRIIISPTVVEKFCVDKYEYPNQEGKKPLTNVSWYKAKRLCKKQGKRLCSNREWAEACRGCSKKTKYPYGNTYEKSSCVSNGKKVELSGSRRKCVSTYGVYDMVGNVAEWTDNLGVGSYGGSYKNGKKANCYSWKALSIKRKYSDVGFRCCKTLIKRVTVPAGKKDCPKFDRDGDGVFDMVDACIDVPEDKDGYEDSDGCPDYDNDGDGIKDSIDTCPFKAEDMDGYKDSDGCPDYDNDHDGILDSLDKCPNKKEDIDGYEDTDGCPDYDNDSDSVPDSLDKCPQIKGSPNNNGCPEIKKPVIKMEIKKPVILKGIRFKTNSDKFIGASTIKALEITYNSLFQNPKVCVEIRGHTDNIGNDNFNLKLSQKRANAVRNYLIKRGIEAYRIKAIGCGERNPIASNRKAKGRALNRRVEIYRTK